MEEEKNSSKFLNYFNEIESYLRRTFGYPNETGFTYMINETKKKNNIIHKYYYDLYEFSELRNAIVHHYKKIIIAEPNDSVITQISKISELLKNPPKVRELLKNKTSISTLGPDNFLKDFLDIMIKNNYSQIPIVEDKNVLGLLTSNTITRFLGINTNNDFSELLNEKLLNILKYTEYKNYDFIQIDSSVFNIINKFEEFLSRGRFLDALLVTQNGKNNESLMGIITSWDLQSVYKIV